MPVRRTELRDDLTALIAAGRELSPEHDQALADVFIDQLATKTAAPPRARRTGVVLKQPRRLASAIVLALACLGTASLLSVNHSSGPASMQVPAVAKMKMPAIARMKMPAKVSAVPGTGKGPAAPIVPKAPSAPKAPEPKPAS
jgi:hypothetical protein